LLLDIVIGLLLGLLSWWIVTRAVTPRIWISPDISKLPDSTGNATYTYRVKVFNLKKLPLPKKPAIDIKITANLSILGVDSTRPKTWFRMNVPVGNTGELAYMRHNSIFRLRLHDIPARQAARLPEHLHANIATGEIQLEDLLRLGSKSHLRVVVTAAHIYTWGRSLAEWSFHLNHIVCGAFDADNGRRVAEDLGLCNELQRPAETQAQVALRFEIDEGH
jgi:hypothetical protein